MPLRLCSYQGSELSQPALLPTATRSGWPLHAHTQQDLARTPKCSSSPRELGLTWDLLGLHLLPVLLQHRLALGGGKHPCGRYSPSFPLLCLLCPYSAHLKQETIKARRLSICLLHNLQPLTSALNSGMFLSSASSSCSPYRAKFYKFSNTSSDARAPLKPLWSLFRKSSLWPLNTHCSLPVPLG